MCTHDLTFIPTTCTLDRRTTGRPLRLEPGHDNNFLETTIFRDRHILRHRLKNDNEHDTSKIWRYQHYCSHGSGTGKTAVLKGCLTKVHRMASDKQQLQVSAICKLQEFARLEYPWTVINGACKYMAISTQMPVWFDIRDQMQHYFEEKMSWQ